MGNKDITMTSLNSIGFVNEKNYPHDHFFTHRYIKGCLRVELTWDMNQKGKRVSTEVQIEDGDWRDDISFSELQILDIILNR